MKKGWYVMLALGLQALAPVSHAARASATFDVSFRVQESCAIRTARAPDAAPGATADKAAPAQDADVRCQYQTPYLVQTAASASTMATAPRRTERPRDAEAPAALTVWF